MPQTSLEGNNASLRSLDFVNKTEFEQLQQFRDNITFRRCSRCCLNRLTMSSGDRCTAFSGASVGTTDEPGGQQRKPTKSRLRQQNKIRAFADVLCRYFVFGVALAAVLIA